MKNLFKATFAAGLVPLAISQSCLAQGAFDVWGATRTLIVGAPSQMLYSAAPVTNNAVDLRMFTGVVKLDLFVKTNTTGTLTATIETSTDSTNWSAVTFAKGVATAINYTNIYYAAGTNNIVITNNYVLPGTITTPTAATSGWYTPYLAPAAFTNSGAITLVGNTVTSVGFKADDQLRYLHIVWTPGGTGTNLNYGAVLTGRILGGSDGL